MRKLVSYPKDKASTLPLNRRQTFRILYASRHFFEVGQIFYKLTFCRSSYKVTTYSFWKQLTMSSSSNLRLCPLKPDLSSMALRDDGPRNISEVCSPHEMLRFV
jgi:hypothetical protein